MTHRPSTSHVPSAAAQRWLDWGRSAATLALAVAVLVAPGPSGGFVAGPPLTLAGQGLLATLAVAGCVLLLFRLPSAPRALPLALVLILVGKMGLATFDEPSGWQRRVVLADNTIGTSFWAYGERTYRIDPEVRFDGAHFGLHFFNDIRYSTGAYAEGSRDVNAAWRATWTGFVHRATPRAALVGRLTATGGVTVLADGIQVASLAHPAGATFPIVPTSSTTRFEVVYDKPAGVRPSIEFRLDGDPELRVVPYADVAVDPRPQELRRELSTAGVGIGIGWLVLWMAWQIARGAAPRWPATRLATLAVVAGVAVVASGAVVMAARHADQTYHMSSGNDPLVYEGNARDIMANGMLMLAGRPLGEARPYFHYPLYPYVVAVIHWGVGDDAAAVMLGNGLLIASVLPLLWILGWHRLGRAGAIVAVGVATWVLVWHGIPYAVEVFTDNLFLPLVIAGIVIGAWAARTDRAAAWLLTGAAIALGAAARPSLLTNLPVLIAVLLLCARWRGWSWAMRASVLVASGFALGVAPFTLRNYIASGQLVMLVNSWVGLAVFLVPPGESYAFLGFDGTPLTLVESLGKAYGVFRDHPWRTVLLEVRKVFFTFGFTNLAHAQPLYVEFVAFWIGGLVAVVRRRVDAATLIATGAFAASHVLAMVMAAPWTYGYKSILPIQFVFLFWAAFLLPGASRRAVE